jgi:L-ascorbate metabolism protein UlaG (beta-lactamase superfamily)
VKIEVFMTKAATPNLFLTHIDGPTMLIELENLRILTDPTFDPAGSEYAFGPIVLRKTSDPALSLEAVGDIDLVLLSHDEHADNLDHTGRSLLARAETVLTTPGGAARLGGNAKGLERWATATYPLAGGRTLTITATPARHGPPGCEPVTGEVTGFVLSWPDTDSSGDVSYTVYVSGDTVWFNDLLELRTRFRIDLAILHLGNVHIDAVGPDNLTMNAAEAITMAKQLSIPKIIPIHVDGWEHFQESKSQVQVEFANHNIPGLAEWLTPGVRTSPWRGSAPSSILG